MNIFQKYLVFVVFLIGLVLITNQTVFGQYKIGVDYFDNEQYQLAIQYFNLEERANENVDLLEKRMIAYYKTNQIEKSKEDISLLLQSENVPDATYKYIGKIYHSEENFTKAIEHYKEYLRRTNVRSDDRQEVIHSINQCASGIRLAKYESYAFINNFGQDVNTEFDELHIHQSPNYSNKYYFSSNRNGSILKEYPKDGLSNNYSFDMYQIEEDTKGWTNANPISQKSNTSLDEILLDFNDRGDVIVYLQGPNRFQGYLKADTANIENQKTNDLSLPIKPENGDSYVHFYNDSTVLYSSLQEGGFGGYDIYLLSYRNGRWMKPINLGPQINGPFDEISPFISHDGLSLYYSSNRIQSMGGYDVYMCSYDKRAKKWQGNRNLCSPINSSGDDIFFSLDKNGLKGFLSSDRKSGYGGMDLYVAYLKNQVTGQLAIVPELPMLSDKYPKLTTSAGELTKEEASKIAENTTDESSKFFETNAEFVIDPLYISNSESQLSNVNKEKLRVVLDLMTYYPNLTLDVHSFSNNDGIPSYELFFCAKKAESVVSYIASNGIDPARIHVFGFGSSYPAVIPSPNGNPSQLAEKINNRIECNIRNDQETPLNIFYKKPIISKSLQADEYKLLQEKSEGLVYRIQVKKSDQIFQHQLFLQYDDPLIYKNGDDSEYTYLIGMFREFKFASRTKTELQSFGLEELRILPFINGVEIKRDEVVDYATRYPDLIKYIQYND